MCAHMSVRNFLFTHMPNDMPLRMPIHMSIHMSICISIHMSIHVSICMSIHMSVHTSMQMSTNIVKVQLVTRLDTKAPLVGHDGYLPTYVVMASMVMAYMVMADHSHGLLSYGRYGLCGYYIVKAQLVTRLETKAPAVGRDAMTPRRRDVGEGRRQTSWMRRNTSIGSIGTDRASVPT